MLTMPNWFESNRAKRGAQRRFAIFMVLNDVTTFTLGDPALFGSSVSDKEVIPVLDSAQLSLKTSLKIRKKKAVTSDIPIVCSNRPITLVSGGRGGVSGRLSDMFDIETWHSAQAFVYAIAGAMETGWRDHATLIYYGKVASIPTYNADQFRFTIKPWGVFFSKEIPDTYVGDVYASAPEESKTRKIPVVYGQFSEGSDTVERSGLAKTEPIQQGWGPKWVISNHVLKTIDNSYVLTDFLLPNASDLSGSGTTNVDDSGRGTIQFTILPTFNDGFIRPTVGVDLGSYNYSANENEATNLGRAFDGRLDTYAELLDYVDDGTQRTARAVLAFPSFDAPAGVGSSLWRLKIIAEASYGSFTTEDFRVIHGQSGGSDVIQTEDSTIGVGTSKSTISMSATFYGSDYDNWRFQEHTSQSGAEDWPYVVLLEFQTDTSDTGADGVALNSWVIRLYDVQLVLSYGTTAQEDLYVACTGHEYGTWINSRSSEYASGDLIEDPAGIIESLLRNELGVVAANIDLPSFISAENTSVTARVNLHSDNQTNARDLIQQLAEQSTFAFIWGQAGEAKLIDMQAAPGSVDKTIYWFDLVENPTISSSDFLVNKLIANHTFLHHAGTYLNNEIFEDATSQSDLDEELVFEAKWPNIASSSATHVGQHYVNTTDGIWSKVRPVIEFGTWGFSNAEIEVGDWVSFDADSFDARMLLNGASWDGLKFLVTEVNQTIDATMFKAIKLY